ncbi:Methyltransferase type 11 [Desulfarculus baarsii DSM 2075]|uniref:Methyltransferase type 11 n=1 Tax=Desulfarculus baarsii (strain ATCC 33931 / DSM 2075 / LMG 7858 / VKM B-1802 / 2st14) TaxID=644282 RepID=E1QEU1_DESB2|nr:class I SAM-dependent methyltransferase [Desulfarculus baarsii]ADK84077.1 Methyltransferase type 11 [Desulfarculus baarsii DSM 2075]
MAVASGLPKGADGYILSDMDKIFEAQETAQYEAWLETPAGAQYLRASCALLDQILDFTPGWRVLDVGCGLGAHLEHLHERGMFCQGLEAGPVAAKLASQRLGGRARIVKGDAHDLPFDDNEFDAVVLVNTLELTERRAQVLAEAARVAASRVCVISANPFDPSAQIARWLGRKHPVLTGRPIGLLGLRRLVREVLGPVPTTWSSAVTWPWPRVGRHPLGELVGLCAAVTPRLRAMPLPITTAPPVAGREALRAHGRVSSIHRVK